jgi:spermidine dehydrogenase
MKSVDKAKKLTRLATMSYRAFLTDICFLPKDACDFLQGRSNDNFGLGIDAIAALDAISDGFPGAKGLGLEAEDLDAEAHGGEPYVHHFPDGNASIARLIVRSLVPSVAHGANMEDIVTQRFDYSKLDDAGAKVRIRLNSTAVVVRNEGKGVGIGYIAGGKLHRVHGKRAIVTAYNVIVPHLVPELPQAQKDIMSQNVKTPLLYTKVVLRNWESFVKLGVHAIAAPMSFNTTVKLDYPVSLGKYKAPRDPREPIGLQLVHVPLEPNQGLSARDQCRSGRISLFTTTFQEFEKEIRSDLDRMLGPGGFESGRDIMAITVNRWSHGYSYYWNSLYDDVEASEKLIDAGRARAGRISFASADTAWDAYAHAAIAEAARAADEAAG